VFRQIQVDHTDDYLQRIVSSPRTDLPPVEYRLKTVTYRTSCAPYLAMCILQQLAQEGKSRFPLSASCNESNICKKRRELVDVLQSAGIELDKWASNQPELLPTSA
jgi:hypothetical protein